MPVRALLEKWGYEAEDASEGLEGFSRTKEADIRIVVCDWMMPGMSGLDLCRAVREAELGHYVYIILLTGRSDKADLLKGLRAGADDFLSKPYRRAGAASATVRRGAHSWYWSGDSRSTIASFANPATGWSMPTVRFRPTSLRRHAFRSRCCQRQTAPWPRFGLTGCSYPPPRSPGTASISSS